MKLLISTVLMMAIIGGTACNQRVEKENPEDETGDTGGNPDPGGAGGTQATWTNINNKILKPKCVSCHSPGGSGALDADFTTWEKSMDSVVANDPDGSPLYRSIANGSMPKGGSPLPESSLKLVEEWIKGGALKNAQKENSNANEEGEP